ncbi:hypothetical protein H9P43_002197 [Blastocladiella emersonii ATCC 22665]|nr:hypothetical protein H9P43_002197 [Blastocladiella emersonii ATCC 22665]
MERLQRDIDQSTVELVQARSLLATMLVKHPPARRWVLSLGLRPEDLPQGMAEAVAQSQGVLTAAQQAQLVNDIPAEDRHTLRAHVDDVNMYRNQVIRQTMELREVRSAHTFMETVLDAVQRAEEQTCPVCLDSITSDFAITACAHIYCLPCGNQLKESANAKCPICRHSLSDGLTQMRLDPTAAEVTGEAEGGAAAAAHLVKCCFRQ